MAAEEEPARAKQPGNSEYANDENQPNVLFRLRYDEQGQTEEHTNDGEMPLQMDAGQETAQGKQQHGIETGCLPGFLSRIPDHKVQAEGNRDSQPVQALADDVVPA